MKNQINQSKVKNMENNFAKYLINQYNTGKISSEEEKQLESFIENGAIQLEELNEIQLLDQQLQTYFDRQVSTNLRKQFDQFLELEKAKQPSTPWGQLIFRKWMDMSPSLQLSLSVILFVFGLSLGRNIQTPVPKEPQAIEDINTQINDIQKMLMLALLEKESSMDRLQLVNETKGLIEVDEQVTDALLYTLNYDESTNVRLAALESLYQYAKNSKVREGLVRSIVNQESPMVQLALAEIMVALKEKRAIESFETLLKRENMPSDVKRSIRQKMDVLL